MCNCKKYLLREKQLKSVGFLFKFSLDLSSVICIFIYCIITAKDPFENHIIGNLINYYNDEINSTNVVISKHNNNNFIYPYIKKYILNKKNISSKNNNTLFLRKLVSDSFCSEIRDNLLKYKGKRLSNIFDLNINITHIYTILYIVISFVLLCLGILFIFFEKKIKDYSTCLHQMFFQFLVSLYLLRFLFFLFIIYFIEKGDAGKYNDFLKCPKTKIKIFDSFNHYRDSYYSSFSLNILLQIIDKFEKCFEENDKNDKENNSIDYKL